jgi:hypothetical protein
MMRNILTAHKVLSLTVGGVMGSGTRPKSAGSSRTRQYQKDADGAAFLIDMLLQYSDEKYSASKSSY